MQFEVPQFIEIEDKIFGPLTWRQFLYVGGGGLMSAVLFLTTPFILFVLLGLPIGILAFALAFYPVNNRPFSHLLEAMWQFMSRSRVYHWQRKQNIVYKDAVPPQSGTGSTNLSESLMNKKDIASLARRLELDALQKK
ncbi:MAG: PrgI family protein [Candidatus Pacebacteria bacterium]|jgi:hypothetical protein|nr:PrgI family protein [Candidatus Paceibacterota bacterium]